MGEKRIFPRFTLVFLVRKSSFFFYRFTFKRLLLSSEKCLLLSEREEKFFLKICLAPDRFHVRRRDESSFLGIALYGPIREEARFPRYRNNSSPPNVAYIYIYTQVIHSPHRCLGIKIHQTGNRISLFHVQLNCTHGRLPLI